MSLSTEQNAHRSSFMHVSLLLYLHLNAYSFLLWPYTAELSVHLYCHPVPGLNQLLDSGSALTFAQWCFSLDCHLPGLCPGGRFDIGLPHLALHSLVSHVGKICHNPNFLRTETQVLGGYISEAREDSSRSLWLYTLVSMVARPAGFPFLVPLWSRIPGFGTTEKMSSTVCVPLVSFL